MQGIAACRAGYCYMQGRVLPPAGKGIAGQGIATCRAGYCHLQGRVLPPAGKGIAAGQGIATCRAGYCHMQGRVLLHAGYLPAELPSPHPQFLECHLHFYWNARKEEDRESDCFF